jgi:hypothetical protein
MAKIVREWLKFLVILAVDIQPELPDLANAVVLGLVANSVYAHVHDPQACGLDLDSPSKR